MQQTPSSIALKTKSIIIINNLFRTKWVCKPRVGGGV